jgi:uncharacterized protein (DUF1697 family)
MSDRRVALLRGINVGRAKRIAMADLREIFEDLGYADVQTMLNSGNVVFSVPGKSAADPAVRIEEAIADRLGISTRVIVLDTSEVAEALRGNPLASTVTFPPRFLLVALRDVRSAALLKPLAKVSWAPEAFAVRKRIAYLWCPEGIAESPLWVAVDRATGDAGTARNFATMTKLLALMESPIVPPRRKK